MALKRRSKIISVFLVCLLLISFSLFFLLLQPNFLAGVAELLLSKSSAVKVERIHFKSIVWNSWKTLILKDVHVLCSVAKDSYQISAPEISIDQLDGLLDQQPVLVSVKELNVDSKQINISHLKIDSRLHFKSLKYRFSFTDFLIEKFTYGSYVVTALKGMVYDNKTILYSNNIRGILYGGTLNGQGWVKYLAPLTYNIQAHVSSVNSMLLSEANPNFAQFVGIIEGDVKVQNLKDYGLSLEADFHAPQGGKIKASLLTFMAQYIPQKRQIEDLVKKDEQVFMDKAQITIDTLSAQKVSSQVKLSSSSLNLNMNVKFDINIEDGFQYLLEYAH